MIPKPQLEVWSRSTWHESLVGAKNKHLLDNKEKHLFINRLGHVRRNDDYMLISNSKVTGSITQGWEDQNFSGPLFQQSLVSVMESFRGNWTPAEYLIHYFRQCLDMNLQIERIELGRALRNLPSFMREYLLSAAISSQGYHVKIPDVADNASIHIDLEVAVDDSAITIWSYLNSPNAISKLKTKIRSRGEIKPGLNLLAPITSGKDTENYLNWFIPSADYVKGLIDACRLPPESFKEISADVSKQGGFSNFRLFIKGA